MWHFYLILFFIQAMKHKYNLIFKEIWKHHNISSHLLPVYKSLEVTPPPDRYHADSGVKWRRQLKMAALILKYSIYIYIYICTYNVSLVTFSTTEICPCNRNIISNITSLIRAHLPCVSPEASALAERNHHSNKRPDSKQSMKPMTTTLGETQTCLRSAEVAPS